MISSPPGRVDDALSNQANKQGYVDWVFAGVADRYDLGNDIMSLGWHTRWKRRLVEYADLKPGMRVLDLACGTGDVTYLVAAKVAPGEVVGLDIHPDMLRLAEPKRPEGCTNVRFEIGDATKLPYPDASFDRVTIGYAGRGFPDWPAVVRESFRVLKPGGQLWNLDFARPENKLWDATYRGWMTASGAVLGTVLHGDPRIYTYIPASMKHYRGQRWLRDVMAEAGFEAGVIETLGQIMAFNHGTKPA